MRVFSKFTDLARVKNHFSVVVCCFFNGILLNKLYPPSPSIMSLLCGILRLSIQIWLLILHRVNLETYKQCVICLQVVKAFGVLFLSQTRVKQKLCRRKVKTPCTTFVSPTLLCTESNFILHIANKACSQFSPQSVWGPQF